MYVYCHVSLVHYALYSWKGPRALHIFIVDNFLTHDVKAVSTLDAAKAYVSAHAQSTHDYKWWCVTEHAVDSDVAAIYHYYDVNGERWCAYTMEMERA